MAELMLKQDLVRYMPPLAVTFFLPPLVRLVGEIKCSRNGFRDKLEYFVNATGQFCNCVKGWPIADSACVLVEGLLSRARTAEVPSATSAVFLDQDRPHDQASTMDTNNQSVIPENLVSTIETETTLPRQHTVATSGVAAGEDISFPTNIFDEIVWSDIEPWFDQIYSPAEDLL